MTERYTRTARILHWVIGLAIIALLGVGLYMEDLPPGPDKWSLYGTHKSIGMIVLFLVAVRIVWRARHAPPAPLATHQKWERRLAHTIHMLLYLGMVLMPISGYLMSSFGGYPVSIFGLIPVPSVVTPDKLWLSIMKDVHEIGGYALIAGVALHVIGALKHHFIDKDTTLSRMLFTRK